VRRHLRGLLFDEAREIAFGVLGTDDGNGKIGKRFFRGGIDVKRTHGRSAGKSGTNVATVSTVTIDVLPATRGAGPLLQRDYWAVFDDCPLGPHELVTLVKEQFCMLPPSSLVEFAAPCGVTSGAQLDIVIRPAQTCAVRVVHENDQSFTLATLDGHPEAGRITFGSYRNPAGDVIFHIRSRARSTTAMKRLGFLAIGDAMQTTTWTDFIRNTAAAAGASIRGVIHADTDTVDETPEDDEPLQSPTFLATGG
jgi:hypothetical protein